MRSYGNLPRTKVRRNALACNRLPKHFDSQAFVSQLVNTIETSDKPGRDILLSKVLSKYLDEKKVKAVDRKSAAIQKWRAVESRNFRTNCRLLVDQFDKDFGWVTSDALFVYMRRLIKSILRGCPDAKTLRYTITNGATTRINKGDQARYEKITGEMHCSKSALPIWLDFASGTPFGSSRSWSERGFVKMVEHSVLLTVPKKTEIDRVIAKEPECNALLQRAYGLVISDRLRRVGIDLSDQTRNQRLAREGSIDGSLATIDFSSASDTLTRQLMILLLPWEWWETLDALRVKETRLDNEVIDLELFSSMGNGFTFELESLVFYALARAVCYFSRTKGKISVFGDDVILPTAVAARYMRIAHWMGFIPNKDKSCTKGSLRESCGHFYLKGRYVTPFFVRKRVTTFHELINILNLVTKWFCHEVGFYEDANAFAFWNRWSTFVPKYLRGGWDIDSPCCLVDGSRGKTCLVPVTDDSEVLDSSPYLLSLWLGGEYSTATVSLERYRVGKLRWGLGTLAYGISGKLFYDAS